jgi:hypothetical protein
LKPVHQQHLILFIEAIEQCGDVIRQCHGANP